MSLDQDLAHAVQRETTRMAKRTNFWWADPDDLRQEAWLAVLAMRRAGKFDPAKAHPKDGFVPYASLRINSNVGRMICRMRAPVSASDHDRRHLMETRRAPPRLAARKDGWTKRSTLEARPHNAEVLESERVGDVTIERWRDRISIRLREVLGDDDAVFTALARAEEEGRPLEQVSSRAARAVEKLRADPELRQLWEDRFGLEVDGDG